MSYIKKHFILRFHVKIYLREHQRQSDTASGHHESTSQRFDLKVL